MPADIYEFRRTTAEFLSKINRGGNQSPEVVDLYKELISEYVKQYSHGKSQLSSGDVNKYTRKLSSLQVREKNNDVPAMKERVLKKNPILRKGSPEEKYRRGRLEHEISLYVRVSCPACISSIQL